MGTAAYEYRVCSEDDSMKDADALMKKWAEAGWELVSGSSHSWVSQDAFGPPGPRIWHTTYVMFWRRPVAVTTDEALAQI
jgi:hypothetical protein